MERPQASKLVESEQENIECYADPRPDKQHLGGYAISGDGATYYPVMWEYMVRKYNIKSVIDVGCGRGYAADYFKDLGVKVLGVEGSEGGLQSNFLPKEMLVEHDYETDGPYIPVEDFDLCWCCEFVEHIEERCAKNFLATFEKCKYVAITYAIPGQTGHHHVNEQEKGYWVEKIEAMGYKYLEEETEFLAKVAHADHQKYCPFYTSHFISRGLFFERVADRGSHE